MRHEGERAFEPHDRICRRIRHFRRSRRQFAPHDGLKRFECVGLRVALFPDFGDVPVYVHFNRRECLRPELVYYRQKISLI